MYSSGFLHIGLASIGLPARTYLQQLCTDTGCSTENLPRVMDDRDEWRERVIMMMIPKQELIIRGKIANVGHVV